MTTMRPAARARRSDLRYDLRLGSSGRRNPEQFAGMFEMRLAGGASEQAVVTDAIEALGRDVSRTRLSPTHHRTQECANDFRSCGFEPDRKETTYLLGRAVKLRPPNLLHFFFRTARARGVRIFKAIAAVRARVFWLDDQLQAKRVENGC